MHRSSCNSLPSQKQLSLPHRKLLRHRQPHSPQLLYQSSQRLSSRPLDNFCRLQEACSPQADQIREQAVPGKLLDGRKEVNWGERVLEHDRRGAEEAEGRDKREKRGAIIGSSCICGRVGPRRDGKGGPAAIDDQLLVLPLGVDSAADIDCLIDYQ